MLDRVKEPIMRRYEILGWKKFLLYTVSIYLLIVVVVTYLSPINMLAQTKLVIVKASTYILISVGLTMTTRVRKFGNFAQAEFVTFGLYIALATSIGDYNWWTSFMSSVFGTGIFMQMIAAFLFTGILGVVGEILIFGPLIRRKASRLSLMTASIGFGLVIRQVLQEIYTASLKNNIPEYPSFFRSIGDVVGSIPILGWFFVKQTRIQFWGISKFVIVTQNDMWTILVMFITIFILNLIFKKTTLGISMRATSDDAELAQITGINTDRINYWTWFIAAGVTGMGALWRFVDSSFQPATGAVLLLIIFAVVVLGGFDSFEGTLIAGFLVALAESYTSVFNQWVFVPMNDAGGILDAIVFWSPNKDWTQVVPFFIIIVVLLFRPRGLLGLVDPKSKL